MSSAPVSEQQVLDALRRVPVERWGDVVHYLNNLQAAPVPPNSEAPIRTGTDLRDSELIGIWADRTDIGDSREFARQLRKQTE